MANGNGITNIELPYWGRVLVYLIKEIGLNTLVVVLILGMWVGFIHSPMQEQHIDMLTNQRIANQLLNANGAAIIRSADQVDELISVNRAQCVISAQTDEEKRSCFSIRKGGKSHVTD